VLGGGFKEYSRDPRVLPILETDDHHCKGQPARFDLGLWTVQEMLSSVVANPHMPVASSRFPIGSEGVRWDGEFRLVAPRKAIPIVSRSFNVRCDEMELFNF
jgi:hypothetical protein